MTATTVPAGPIPSVTAADGDLMRDALEFQLTDQNGRKRDSAEFRAETIQMGYSLTKLVAELGIVDAEMLAQLQGEPEVALPTAFACAVAALEIPHDAALLAMLFAWAENQVLVCVKSVPLGQVATITRTLPLGPIIAGS